MTLNLHLSEELKQFVNGQAAAGQFDSPAGYVEALIVRAKLAQEKLDSLVIDGLESGDPIPLDASEWSRIRRDVEQRLSHDR